MCAASPVNAGLAAAGSNLVYSVSSGRVTNSVFSAANTISAFSVIWGDWGKPWQGQCGASRGSAEERRKREEPLTDPPCKLTLMKSEPPSLQLVSESATNRRLSKNFLFKIWKARLLEVSSIQTLTPLIVLALFAQEGNLQSGSSVPSSGVVEYNLKWSSFVYSMDKNEVARLWEIAKSLQIKNLFGTTRTCLGTKSLTRFPQR